MDSNSQRCQEQGVSTTPDKDAITTVQVACALQTCLSRHTYTPDKCDDYVQRLYMCCLDMYKTKGESARSTACPAKPVIERWLNRHGQE